MTVYFIRAGDLIKIGYTDDLYRRLISIKGTVVDCDVEFLGHMPGGRDVEKHLHKVFDGSRRKLEWFAESNELLAVIEILADKTVPQKATEKQVRRGKERSSHAAYSAQVRERLMILHSYLPVAKRISAFAKDIGWSETRAKDLYYADPRMSLRMSERDELDVWLEAPKAIANA